MIKKKYILSICIPTYNREVYLKRLLNSIVNQEGFSNNVSIIINDGPSSDNTMEMVKQFQIKHNNIYYYKNEKAVGMLPAILESIKMSNGSYTWLFGSDDFMQKDSIKLLLEEIKTKSPKIILSNRYILNNLEESNDYNNYSESKVQLNGFSDFSIYLGLDEKDKFEDKHNYFTFMSVFCFNTQFYIDSLKYTENNICNENELNKHYFNYILILFSRVYLNDIISIIESPRLVFCQNDNHNWKHNKKISKDIKMLCEYVKNNYAVSNSTIKLLNKFTLRWYFMCNIVTPINKILTKLGLYNMFSTLWRNYILNK